MRWLYGFAEWFFHIHKWTKWKEYGRGVITIAQEKQCEKCGMIRTRLT